MLKIHPLGVLEKYKTDSIIYVHSWRTQTKSSFNGIDYCGIKQIDVMRTEQEKEGWKDRTEEKRERTFSC